MRNSKSRKNSHSSVKGVTWHTTRKIWQSSIRVNGKNKYLGIYKDFSNAVCARLAGEQACNWSGCDSSSPAYKYVQKMLGRDNV